MRIAFVGKGGAGKTTLSAAFISYCQRQGGHVLAIDADVNQQLQSVIGLHGQPILLGDRFKEVSKYVQGERNDLAGSPMIATTPPHRSSGFITPIPSDPFLKRYALQDKGISLLTIGSYEEADIGHTCYHGKLNALETILHHLLDTPRDIVVADATAGIDMLGTSLVYGYDVQVFVVEPTNKSVQVYKDFLAKTAQDPVPVLVIGNKIQSAQDELFLRQQIGMDVLIGMVQYSPLLRSFEQGELSEWERFVDEMTPLWEKVVAWMQAQPARDWEKYLNRLTRVHRATSKEWYNDYYHAPIDAQADTSFRYLEVI